MLTLVFDSCLGRCGAALGHGSDVLRQNMVEMPRGQAEALIPQVAALLQDAGVSWPEIKRIGVTTGPGSFTGVRIGVAAAKAFSLAHDIPVIGLTTLEAVAAQAFDAHADLAHITIAQDARRGQLYCQSFVPAGPIGAPQIYDVEEARQIKGPYAGTGAALIASDPAQILDVDPQVIPATLLRLCNDQCNDKPLLSHRDVHPLYLRPPDAKLPKLSPIAALRQKLNP